MPVLGQTNAHILSMSMPFSFQDPQLDLRLTWAEASIPEADINVYVPIANMFLFNEFFFLADYDVV